MYIQELGYVTLLKKIYTRTKLYYRVAKAWLLLHMCGMLYASMIDVHTIYIHAHCLCQFWFLRDVTGLRLHLFHIDIYAYFERYYQLS